MNGMLGIEEKIQIANFSTNFGVTRYKCWLFGRMKGNVAMTTVREIVPLWPHDKLRLMANEEEEKTSWSIQLKIR